MQIKTTTILIIILTIIIPTGAHEDNYNHPQQTTSIAIDDTALVNREIQTETKNNAALHTKENKQTIRGLFTLGGFNKNEKSKNKKRVSKKD